MHDCTRILPMWSAVADPRVLSVRAVRAAEGDAHLFDPTGPDVRMVAGSRGVHLLIDRGGPPIRLDVTSESVDEGPVRLEFQLADDDRLQIQMDALRAFRAASHPAPRFLQLARRALALQAHDAWSAGASLRHVADLILGRGDWPGDGEHRKSMVRRLIANGRAMIAEGPFAILAAPAVGSEGDRTGKINDQVRL